MDTSTRMSRMCSPSSMPCARPRTRPTGVLRSWRTWSVSPPRPREPGAARDGPEDGVPGAAEQAPTRNLCLTRTVPTWALSPEGHSFRACRRSSLQSQSCSPSRIAHLNLNLVRVPPLSLCSNAKSIVYLSHRFITKPGNRNFGTALFTIYKSFSTGILSCIIASSINHRPISTAFDIATNTIY